MKLPLSLVALVSIVLPALAHAITFDDWRSANFTTSQLSDPTISGATADPDTDGAVNLQEYVFAGSPLTAETGLQPKLELISGTLALTYREHHDLTDVSIRLQGSDTLMNWITFNTVTEAYRVAHTDYDEVTLLDPVPFTGSKRFLRLNLQLTPVPDLSAPFQLSLTVDTPTAWTVRWTDPNTNETGYAVERQNKTTGSWDRLVTLGADTGTWQHTTADYQTGTTYRVVAIGAYGLEIPSAPITLPDRDGDGIPDAFELGDSYAGAAGTFSTYADQADSDGDGMPDGWEIAHGFNPRDPTDANLDTDGDGFTNREEYQEGSDPRDPQSVPRDSDGDGLADIIERRTPGLNPLEYYDNFTPIVTVEDGAGQQGTEGMAPQVPLMITVKNPDGQPLANAPVTVSLVNGYITVEATHADRLILDDTQPRTNMFGFLLFSDVLHNRTQP